jgi:hypothetical protein
MKVLVVAGDVYLLRALLSAFRKRGHMSYGATRGDWALHASKLHSMVPFDAVVVGPEFQKGTRGMETGAEFIATIRKRDPLCPMAMMVPEGTPVPFGVTRIEGDPPCLRRVVRAVLKMGLRQGALPL